MEMKKNIVDFRGPRRKTRLLSPKRKFEIFSEVRLPKLLNAMKSVRNLANKNYYEYTDEQKKKIIRDIQEGYQDMYRAWKNAGKKIKTNKKKSYWDTDNGNS
jgi:hypothetical protein